jgi:hypothetical protein
MPKESKVSDYISIAIATFSMVGMIITGVMFFAGIDKTNAMQEMQIDSINKRLERIENQLNSQNKQNNCA